MRRRSIAPDGSATTGIPSTPGYAGCVRAWWVYWLCVAFAAVLWIAVPLVIGGAALRSLLADSRWLAVFVAPLVVAGLDLVLFRATHEAVCRLEASRHRWLRALVRDGYSASTFLWTGVAVLGLAAVIVVGVATGGA